MTKDHINCSICKKPVEEHLEGRETDRCVAKALGWTKIKEMEYPFGNRESCLIGYDPNGAIMPIPEYTTYSILAICRAFLAKED